MIDIDGESDALKIANKELREKKIPLIIRRFMPDGTYEDWKVKDLIVDQFEWNKEIVLYTPKMPLKALGWYIYMCVCVWRERGEGEK